MQEVIAYTLVVLAALSLGWKLFKKLAAEPTSRWLLKRGSVKSAMWLKREADRDVGCQACSGCAKK